MNKENKFLEEKIDIPEGVSIEISQDIITLKKGDKIVLRKIDKGIPIKIENNSVTSKYEKLDKKTKKKVKSTLAHIINALKGFEENYVYKLQICYVHFPITVSIENNYLIIKNFLGERKERKAKILSEVDIKIDKEFLIIESHDKEKAGQTAANIEKACKIKKRDRRVFQDGIYMIERSKGRRTKE
jgi:large subunit ribosomal protein L6